MKKIILFLIIGLFFLSSVSAFRLPTVGGDEDDWGSVLNDFLSKIAGSDGIRLNETMVNGTNIYPSSINTTHIEDRTINADDLADDSVNSSKIDLTEVTISKFTNDANYLDKDEGGTIDGSLIVNGNFTLIGDYLNATVTNQYLNGSFLPDITNLFDIGSSLLKWANFYITDIYASKVYSDDWTNVTIQESQITDLQSYLTSESDPVFLAWDKDYNDLINPPTIPTIWDESFNNTGDTRWGGADTQKKADENYLYNDTSIIYFNETKLNETIRNIADNYNETDLINSVNSSLSTRIDNIDGGNSSFNQSLTDTLYANIQWGYNMTTPFTDWLSTFAYNYNQTIPANAYADAQDVVFNDSMRDYVDAQISGVAGDNSSWNESYARTIFYDAEADLTTLLDDNYAPVNYGDDWNKTYADTLYAQNSSLGNFVPYTGASSDVDLGSHNLTMAGTLWINGTTGATPTSGAGTRLMWIPAKYAFRAGRVYDTEWDNANIGTYSFATGSNTKASSTGSIALGYAPSGATLLASNLGAIAMGYVNMPGAILQATGKGSQATGFIESNQGGCVATMEAIDEGSYVGGYVHAQEIASTMTSSGKGSFLYGYMYNDVPSTGGVYTVSGDGAFGYGFCESDYSTGTATISGAGAMGGGYILGYNSDATLTVSGTGAFGGGYVYGDEAVTTMTVAGNGAFGHGYVQDGEFLVNGKGAVGIGGVLGGNFHAVGDGAIAIGTATNVDNYYSVGIGYGNDVDGFYATGLGKDVAITSNYGVGIGNNININGAEAVAIGYQAKATGWGAIALGTGVVYPDLLVAEGNHSVAIGRTVEALKEESFCFGTNIVNNAAHSFMFGIDAPDLEIKSSQINAYGNLFVADKSDTGAELILNPNFTGNANNWNLGTGWGYLSNMVRALNAIGTLTQTTPITIVAGHTYYVQYEISIYSGGTLTPSLGGVTLETASAYGKYKEIITATNTDSISFSTSASCNLFLDNVLVKEITGGDLEVLGMVTLSANSTAVICNSTNAGAIYYDGSLTKHYGCDGTIWNALY